MISARVIAQPVSACFLLIALGCGPSARGDVGASDTTAADKISELRAQRRRDQARLRQLEESMAQLAAVRNAERAPPSLRVERIEPDLPPEERADVVAVSDDGTEIVYVGEAAQASTVAADTGSLKESSRTRAPSPTERETPTPREASLRSAPIAAADSLGVTASRLPTVGEVTKSAPPAPRARVSSRATGTRARRPGNASASAVAEYQRHVSALREGKHTEAIAGFRRFVRRYGRSDYADNAQYWLGEAYYDRKMFKEALVEFEQVALAYPSGNKVPDANLKAAYCKANLGDTAGAEAALRALVAEYPGSRVAELAAEKLEHLAK